MKKILAAVDFSEASFNAVSYAAYLANAFNSKLLVVHGYTGTDAIDDEPLTEVFESATDLEAANLNYLHAQMNGLIRKYTVKIEGIVQKGKPVSVIREVAEQENVSLIVMGMKGKGQSNSIFGSTTVDMIGKTDSPLLVIPENARYQPPQNIVVAVDINDQQPVSRFEVLNDLITKYDPFLEILNVQKRGSDLTPDVVSGKMRTGLMWDKYNHSFNIVESDNVEEGINRFLEKKTADMLAMVAQKQSVLQRIFVRSHTRAMTKQTRIPLLVMHATDNKSKNIQK